MKVNMIVIFLCLWTKLFVHSFVQLNPKLRAAKLSSCRSYGMQNNVAIIGSGAFSLALGKALSHRNIHSKLLVRNESVADHINHLGFHPKYLSQFTLPNVISATHDPTVAFSNISYIIHCIPMQISRVYLHSIKHLIPPQIPIISATKGIEQGTQCLMSEILEDTIGNENRFAYLSGPSFAQEIMLGQATAVVIASKNILLAKDVANVFSSPQFRVIPSKDVKGVELSGAIKNVLALAAGMCEGLGLGMNAKSSLVTRGCIEMASMGKLLGADQETFLGLAGVGDTFATCFGPLSRNRKVGFRLAEGETLDEILATSDGVSEGVSTVLALELLIKSKIDSSDFNYKFPVISAIARIVKGKLSPQLGMQIIMRFPLVQDEKLALRSPIHCACNGGRRVSILKLLHDHGLSFEALDMHKKKAPIHIACEFGYFVIVILLWCRSKSKRFC